MRIVVQYQFGGAFYRLGYHAHSILGVNAHLYSGLHGGLDIFQYVSNAAGSHGGGGRYFLLGNQHGKSHLVEDVEQQLFLFFACIPAGDKRHALHLADSGVGDEAEHSHFLICHIVRQLLERYAGRHGDKYLFAFQFEFAHYGLHQPRFNGEYDKLGSGHGFLVVACGLQRREFCLQYIQFTLRRIRNNDIIGRDDGSFGQTAGDRPAHISCTDNCCFHIIL